MKPFSQRRAGILLHPTSLPGQPGNGDLGPSAYHFVDFLSNAGVRVWQMLPLGPTHADLSPYQTTSVHAGDPRLISLELLHEWGLLKAVPAMTAATATATRARALLEAATTFAHQADNDERQAFASFCEEHDHWLDDFALYQVIRETHDYQGWSSWPEALRKRDAEALAGVRETQAAALQRVKFEQYVFFRQWHQLRDYANERDVWLFGDVPIFVAHDSAEVWAHPELFLLDAQGQPTHVAGVPPDYFSETGQRWGNPLYNWPRMAEDRFDWWVQRIATQRELFDLIRIDHFRGFEAYWEIDAAEETAINGHWVKAPGEALFQRLADVFGDLPLVAEDLGTITEEVDHLRRQFGLPGMKILHFAFGEGGGNPYLPHNQEPLSVVYTGTHDNDTTLGWWATLDEATRQHVADYLGTVEDMPWPLIRSAMASVARLAVIPLQDLFSLGAEHRMNTPGSQEGNWVWRFDWSMANDEQVEWLRQLIKLFGR